MSDLDFVKCSRCGEWCGPIPPELLGDRADQGSDSASAIADYVCAVCEEELYREMTAFEREVVAGEPPDDPCHEWEEIWDDGDLRAEVCIICGEERLVRVAQEIDCDG